MSLLVSVDVNQHPRTLSNTTYLPTSDLSLSVTAIVPSAKDRLAIFYLGLAFEDTHIIIIMGGKKKKKKEKKTSWDLCCVWIQ